MFRILVFWNASHIKYYLLTPTQWYHFLKQYLTLTSAALKSSSGKVSLRLEKSTKIFKKCSEEIARNVW